MGFQVNRKQVTEAKSNGGGARWDRPLRKGTYPAVCVFGGMHQSTAGNECMKFTFEINADEEAAPEGPVKLDYYVTSPDGGDPDTSEARAGIVKNFLEALSPDSLGSEDEDVEIEPEDFVDAECQVVVGSEKDSRSGEQRPRISKLKPPVPAEEKAKAKPAKASPKPAAKTPAPAAAPAKDADGDPIEDDNEPPF